MSKTATLVIEKNVPVPSAKQRTGTFSSALRAMEIGDSVFLAGKNTPTVSNHVCAIQREHGRKYTCRAVEGGVRVWRIG